jgi:hypothetical protein
LNVKPGDNTWRAGRTGAASSSVSIWPFLNLEPLATISGSVHQQYTGSNNRRKNNTFVQGSCPTDILMPKTIFWVTIITAISIKLFVKKEQKTWQL